MSSYFDQLARELRDGERDVHDIERQLYCDVTYITGDRQFPADLRERAMGLLACNCLFRIDEIDPPQAAVRYFTIAGGSRALEELHELFHEVARRRVVTRFGLLSDDPRYDGVRRDDHDQDPQDPQGNMKEAK